MLTDADRSYAAVKSRDPRFDGRFFTAVTTTGIYCRPICPARTPLRKNVTFYACAAAAEEAGFRPCRRCRPESAPGTPTWQGASTTVARALRLIDRGTLDDQGVDGLAAQLGIGDRYLRRLFEKHLGASPQSMAASRRAHFARMLLDATDQPVTQVAHASGFRSVRQFNDVIRQVFGQTPTQLRGAKSAKHGQLKLRLAFRPPLAWDLLLDFLARRAIPGVEEVVGGVYRRTFAPFERSEGAGALRPEQGRGGSTERPEQDRGAPVHPERSRGAGAVRTEQGRGVSAERTEQGRGGSAERPEQVRGAPVHPERSRGAGAEPFAPRAVEGRANVLEVRLAADGCALELTLPQLPPAALLDAVRRVRRLFDLDADPLTVSAQLKAAGLAIPPGLRVPGAWDPFETLVRAVLGQQISVAAATTLSGRLAQRFGAPVDAGTLTHLFPSAAALAEGKLAGIGLTRARAAGLEALSSAVANDPSLLAPAASLDALHERLVALPGIGPWTASYVAMRAFSEPDAFPSGDLILRRAAGDLTIAALEAESQKWRPWRAYAAIALWASTANKGAP